MRDPAIVSTSYYHVYNRGVDKRKIFQSNEDFERFLESVYLFTDKNYSYVNNNPIPRISALASHEMMIYVREPLVQILSYELSPNHFHLLMKQLLPGGMAMFFQRLAMGYTKYFNLKYERTGRLLEGPYKAKPVDFDKHLLHLPRYMHLNALDGTSLRWRDGLIEDWDLVRKILDAYPWSSHHVFAGRQQILPVVDEEEVRRLFPNTESYWSYLKEWAGRNTLPFQID